MKPFFLVCISVVLLVSCSMERRHYRNGFYFGRARGVIYSPVEREVAPEKKPAPLVNEAKLAVQDTLPADTGKTVFPEATHPGISCTKTAGAEHQRVERVPAGAKQPDLVDDPGSNGLLHRALRYGLISIGLIGIAVLILLAIDFSVDSLLFLVALLFGLVGQIFLFAALILLVICLVRFLVKKSKAKKQAK